jgi:hypothetical protein
VFLWAAGEWVKWGLKFFGKAETRTRRIAAVVAKLED